MSSSTTSLTGVAAEILQLATTFEEQLENSNLPLPTLESNVRDHYLDILDNGPAVEARSKLIESCNTLLTLARGPVDTLLVDLKTNFFTIAVLRAIYQLNIAEVVPQKGTISIPDLATRLEVHPDGLRRLLRFAFTQGIFREATGQPGHIEHTAISAVLPSIKPMLWIYSGDTMRLSPSSLHFADSISLKNWPRPAVTLADPLERNFWTIVEEDEPDGRGVEMFAAAMKTTLRYTQGNPGAFLAKSFDWAGLGDGAVVVDVGGGNGHNSVSLAKMFPNLKFVVQDMEKNENPTSALIQEAGLAETGRVKFQGHDFFKPQPDDTTSLNPKVYLVSRVLHDWSDEGSVKILANLLPAMKQRGTRLVIVERVLPNRPGDVPLHFEAQLRAMDLNMLMLFGEARERSREDWETLFKAVDQRMVIENVYTPPGSEVSVLHVEYAA